MNGQAICRIAFTSCHGRGIVRLLALLQSLFTENLTPSKRFLRLCRGRCWCRLCSLLDSDHLCIVGLDRRLWLALYYLIFSLVASLDLFCILFQGTAPLSVCCDFILRSLNYCIWLCRVIEEPHRSQFVFLSVMHCTCPWCWVSSIWIWNAFEFACAPTNACFTVYIYFLVTFNGSTLFLSIKVLSFDSYRTSWLVHMHR